MGFRLIFRTLVIYNFVSETFIVNLGDLRIFIIYLNLPIIITRFVGRANFIIQLSLSSLVYNTGGWK
jgi:hypothetical protein